MRRILFSSLALLLVFSHQALAEELSISGFLEVGAASRVVEDDHAEDDFLMGESRFQLDLMHEADVGTMQFRGDFLFDGVEGDSELDIREANILATPLDSVDLKIGRQVLTWGTGDLVFLNDLFPKDWQSFFIGRDDEYLKKPSNAVRGTWFGDVVSVDMAWVPIFDSDGYISGERLSYWGGMGTVGPMDSTTPISPDEPDHTLGNSEISARVYSDIGGWEWALYGYRGRYGQPLGMDAATSRLYFPRLASGGASLRGSILGGVANFETSYYRSMDDPDGDNPYVVNSEARVLAGYSHELITNHNLGVQLYLERVMDWDSTAEDGGGLDRDEDRVWVTVRYMAMFMQQNLICSLFAFISPTDEDVYLRPKVTYKASDNIKFTVGGNVFIGDEDTFFGQFENDTNVYARVKYSF